MPLNVKCRTEDNVRLTAKLCGIIENMNMNLLDFINATVNLQWAEAGGVLKSTQHSPLSCVRSLWRQKQVKSRVKGHRMLIKN